MQEIKKFKRVMVANRGEIAIRIFRACKELGIRTVAIYSEEDKNTLFRSKADEAYQIGKGKSPVQSYLGIEEIISLAKAKGVDAIHPGYGFLSENPDFARACIDAGITFIGPDPEMMEKLGDKVKSKIVAKEAGVPTIPGVDKDIETEEEALSTALKIGFPVMIKAAMGGGGRGMRIVRSEEELIPEFRSAKSEARKAFGDDSIFIEKYLKNPKHIEVQILGDGDGNIVHLYERDCSLQRRHQKVIEFTPSISISEDVREALLSDALKIANAVKYKSAGTVEFLVDGEGNHYFIEMNPRIQVEHTISEITTGIDIVQSQILIAEGYALNSEEIGIMSQDDISQRGYAIQCRVTTENPLNNFMPETGVIESYRSPGGFGIRLDGGNGFQGSEIKPFYDSLLVKVTAYGRTFDDARRKATRALRETVVKGVKTNIAFMLNVLNHPVFAAGNCTTNFIQDTPELLNLEKIEDTELKVIAFLGNKIVNETKGFKPQLNVPIFPKIPQEEISGLSGTKKLLDSKGPEAVSKWAIQEKKLLITDTTLRDANQSLMATRLRTVDMEKIAPAYAKYGMDFFSLEMWGGATFDTAFRFLKENPWERLETLRAKIPNVMFEMLLRGANAVGYKNYPDNVIRKFIEESAKAGIDVFRVFDSLNWVDGIEVAMDEVLNQNKVLEATICYTGDILDEKRDKYSLNYYVKLAKELEKRGAHILGIKDMSGLLKPMAAQKLISTLKNEIGIPIHLHTHDTSGNGVATVLMAAQAGVDIVDTAINSMSGLTSQPALGSVVAALENSGRDTGLNPDELQKISDYFSDVRPCYRDFESDLTTSTTDIYKYEIPGGQYSNLRKQVESFGIGHKFDEVKEMYRKVNMMFGDIVKVTPSSKAVGDMAIFMVQNGLTPENILVKGVGLDYPDSVVAYFSGMMGQPEGGFPKPLQDMILNGRKSLTVRPGLTLKAEDFDEIRKTLKTELDIEPSEQDIISYALYPKVFTEYIESVRRDGDFRYMGSDIFFHALSEGETSEVKLGEGKFFMVKLVEVKKLDRDGYREVVFEVNGNRRNIRIRDNSALASVMMDDLILADEKNPKEVGATIPGNVVKVLVKEGETIKKGQQILVLEAMKMETSVIAGIDGVVEKIYVVDGDSVKQGELVARLK